MATPSTRCKHMWKKDAGDPRFKVCGKCGKSKYRTDKELMKEAGLK